jgi:hypothetical protein
MIGTFWVLPDTTVVAVIMIGTPNVTLGTVDEEEVALLACRLVLVLRVCLLVAVIGSALNLSVIRNQVEVSVS